MKDLENMQVLVMTLPHMPHRYWYSLGALDAMRFKIPNCHSVMGKYWKDYESCNSMIDAAIKDGFPWFDGLRIRDNQPDIEWSFRANLWSSCRALRYIASQQCPAILTEDDHRFRVKLFDLRRLLDELPYTAEIVIFSTPHDGAAIENEKYSDNWMKGEFPQKGAFCNLYTPKGARHALEIASRGECLTYENLAAYYNKKTTFYPTNQRGFLISSTTPVQNATSHPGGDSYMGGEHKEFRGYSSDPVLDRWSKGLNIDP